MSNTIHSTRLGRVISTEEAHEIDDFLGFVQEYQVIVLRGASLSISEQMELTRRLGVAEQSWEDAHPDCEYLQLMDSRKQKKLTIKSSSKYWHLDRSFMPVPTRYTLLHAVEIGNGARGTQFVDSRRLMNSFPPSSTERLRDLSAEHDFALRFPEIMGAKGVTEQRISELRKKYPPSIHPLVHQSKFGESLYFNELCVGRVVGVSDSESAELVSLMTRSLHDHASIYEHVWQPNDTLIWDNFATIHRARPDGTQGVRVLHRSTAF
jgi:alpha-ketoglutarate-dependent taurine dioxygenase